MRRRDVMDPEGPGGKRQVGGAGRIHGMTGPGPDGNAGRRDSTTERGSGAVARRGGTTRHVDAWLAADAQIDRLIAKGKLG